MYIPVNMDQFKPVHYLLSTLTIPFSFSFSIPILILPPLQPTLAINTVHPLS